MTEEQVFLAALDLPNPNQRSAYLDKVCGGESGLRQRVESLLVAHYKSGEFLNEPAVQQLGTESPNFDETMYGPGNPEGDAVANENNSDEEPDDLHFLQPTTRTDSLGRMGHYEILQVLGKGGFGIVFRAFDDVLQRVVALKVLAPAIAATSPARKRFLREARASARVRNENVVQVHAVEEVPIPYLVMEFIAGETLQQRLDRKGPLEATEIVSLGWQIAEGLAAAHATGLIHRDIKPGNILVEGGSNERVKITDFGLARAADDASMTQSGMVAGTPMFMAPEQAQGETLDQRADLFSLGSVLYVMASGRPPFRAATTFAVLKRVVEEEPRPIRDLIPETPQWLCDIIAKLHAKQPEERYQSAREVADVLANCAAQLKEHSKLKDLSLIPRAKVQPEVGWKWVVAALVLPLLAIGAYFASRPGSQPKVVGNGTDPTKTVVAPSSNQGIEPVVAASEGWTPIFNGQDLTGWKTHPEQPGPWKVKDGILIGSSQQSHLFTERADFANFHLRAEVKISQGGDSGIRFRVPFKLLRGKEAWQVIPAGGYEAEFTKFPSASAQTGSVWRVNQAAPPNTLFRSVDEASTQPDEWQTYEVVADGNHFITKLNGREVANCTDGDSLYSKGQIALQCFSPQTRVQFRKIEIKEVAAGSPQSVAPALAVAPFSTAQARAHQKAWAEHLGLPVEYSNSIGMKFVLIPPGEFMMGSSAAEVEQVLQGLAEDPNKDIFEPRVRASAPQHRVMLTQPRYLAIHEVTQAQYEKVMGKNPAHFAETGAGKDAVVGVDTANYPVDMVTWLEAIGFCLELGKQEKLKPSYLQTDQSVTQQDGTGYRLPTEAEWEFSCRAGSVTSYSTGDQESDLVRVGWFVANSNERPHAAGELQANPFGLYDMHGNVWEWIQDWSDYTYYQQVPKNLSVDPVGPAAPTGERGLRGGMIACPAFRCRSSNRDAYVPTAGARDVGFRVSLTVEAVKAAQVPSATAPQVKPTLLAGPFNEAAHKQIAALPAAEQVEVVRKELKRLNPGFDGMLVTMIENDIVTELSFNSDHVENIAPIRALAGLVYLDCRGTYPNRGKLADLSPLKGMKLKRIDCSSTQISDLTPLADMPLTWLQFNHNPVSDLTPLKKMPLVTLGCAETKVSDFAPLKGLKLQVLGAQLLAVTDLSPLEGMELTGLDLYHTIGVTDLSPLKGMPLEGLNLQDVPVKDLSPLKDMKTLRTLQLTGTAVTDLGPLQGLKLSDLIFQDRQISDLSPLKGMPLVRLIIHGSGVTDLRPLQGMPLQEIRLTPKNITQGLETLRELKSLTTIGIDGDKTYPPAEFWERYDKGKFRE